MVWDTRFWGGILILCLIATGVGAADRAILTTRYFSSGSIAVVDLETFVATENVLNIHGDALVQFYNGRVYVINRLKQDNILVLNPEDLGKPERQFSVGNGTNPWAIAFVSDTKAYVTRYASTHLLIVNPSTGDSLGSVDLSGFADSDGIPEMSQMAIWQEQLYVLCQRLDRNNGFAPTDRSEVAVVDVNTDALKDMDANEVGVQGIVLALKNPVDAVQVQDQFYLSCVGSFTEVGDGGIEVLNLAENTSRGVVVGETELGGNSGALAVGTNQKGYTVVLDATFATTVIPFDASAKTVLVGLSGISGGFVSDLGILNGRLYVADQGSSTDPTSVGLRVYDTQTDGPVAGPIATGLRPSDLAFITETQDQPTEKDGTVELPTGLSGPIALDLNLEVGDQGQRQTSTNPKSGDSVVIDIVAVSGANGNIGFQVVLTYDATQLQFDGFQTKDLWAAGVPIVPPASGGEAQVQVALLGQTTSSDAGSMGHATFSVLEGFSGTAKVEIKSASYDQAVEVGAGGQFVVLGGVVITIPSDPVEAADFSGDGAVDFNDFLSFAQNFGKSSDDSDFNARIDITEDGKVDFADFLAFAQQFGKQVGG